MPMVVKHLQLHLTQREELQQCLDILSELLIILEDPSVGATEENVSVIVHALFRTVLKTVAAVDRNNSYSGQLVSNLVAILRAMDVKHFRDYMQSFTDRDSLLEFISESFAVFMDLVSRPPFPQDWFVMAMLHNSGIMSGVTSFGQALATHYLSGDTFDYQLWNTYFLLSVSFVCQDVLQLEKYSPTKQHKVLQRYGDMRLEMNHQVLEMWNCLGDLKMRFIPDLVGPFVEMALIDHDGVQASN
jgi:dedicator of cytokinesis protein 1